MNKKTALEIMTRALQDRSLPDGGLRLLLHLTRQYGTGQFSLSSKEAAALCGLKDRNTAAARLKSLCPKYLKSLGVKGCPPVNQYEIQLRGKPSN